MRPYRPTALTRVPIVLLEQARALGVDRRTLMGDAGLTAAEIKDPDGRVPSLKVWNLWQALARRVPDEALGLKLSGGKSPASRYGLVSYSLYYSGTLMRALQRLARYSGIVSETIRVHVKTRGDRCRIHLESDPQFEALRHPIDARLAHIVVYLRNLSGKAISPLEVELPYARLRDLSYHRRFFAAPLRFSRPRAALWYLSAQLELPVIQADETLAGYLDRLAEQKLRELDARSWAGKVGRALWPELSGGPPPIRHTAAALSLSPRTLQRYLRSEGTSYRGVLEDLRRRMSTHLIHRGAIAASEVAFLLGYADPSAFHHAFRRWHRTTPRAYRRAG
jgi:AraC-like DNA-binding protein